MAIVYAKPITDPAVGFDRNVILSPRESLVYPCPYDNWNILRVGFMVSVTTAADNNGDTQMGHNGTENVSVVLPKDRFFIGMKNNNSLMPGDGENFVGLFNKGDNTQIRSVYDGFSNANLVVENSNDNRYNCGVMHANNTTHAATSDTLPLLFGSPERNMDTFNYSFFHGLTLTILNKGLPNQSINVKYSYHTNDLNGDGLSKRTDAQLKALMTSAPFIDYGNFDFNLSGTPYLIPNSLFLHFPFAGKRLRIHHVGIIKES